MQCHNRKKRKRKRAKNVRVYVSWYLHRAAVPVNFIRYFVCPSLTQTWPMQVVCLGPKRISPMPSVCRDHWQTSPMLIVCQVHWRISPRPVVWRSPDLRSLDPPIVHHCVSMTLTQPHCWSGRETGRREEQRRERILSAYFLTIEETMMVTKIIMWSTIRR